jgi:3-hydroxyacyl-[acyl-carrier-protein] dehydratase
MIGAILHCDDRVTRTSFTIPEQNPLVKDGLFTEGGLIENMAQTVAAGTGQRALKDNLPAPTGYIAALKNVRISSLPHVHDTIETEITFQQTLLSFHLVTGKVMLDGKEIASCELKIFVNTSQPVKP